MYYLSISPKTISEVPISATKSPSAKPQETRLNQNKLLYDGDLTLHLTGLGPPSNQMETPKIPLGDSTKPLDVPTLVLYDPDHNLNLRIVSSIE